MSPQAVTIVMSPLFWDQSKSSLEPHTSQLASHVDRLHTQGMESVGNGRSTRADLGHTSTHNNTEYCYKSPATRTGMECPLLTRCLNRCLKVKHIELNWINDKFDDVLKFEWITLNQKNQKSKNLTQLPYFIFKSTLIPNPLALIPWP